MVDGYRVRPRHSAAPPFLPAMRALGFSRLLTVVLAIAALVGLVTAEPSWAGPGSALRPQDEIFEIDTRGACCSTNAERLRNSIRVREYAIVENSGGRRWVDSDFSRIAMPADPTVTTLVYVHGNDVSACDVRRRSLDVYRTLVRSACDERPVRFIVWSWPADKQKGLLRDFRVKAARTRPVAWQLAWGLDQLPPETPIGLLGYSYGARVVGGAMHLLGGGDMDGLALCERVHPARPPVRVAFLAAATDANWFGPGQYHGLAMTQIDDLLLVNNQKDPAMRFYKFIEKGNKPQALGYAGPTCIAATDRHRVHCYDATNCVGRTHNLYDYMMLRRTMITIWRQLTYADRVAAP